MRYLEEGEKDLAPPLDAEEEENGAALVADACAALCGCMCSNPGGGGAFRLRARMDSEVGATRATAAALRDTSRVMAERV